MKILGYIALGALVLCLLFFAGVNKDSSQMPDRDDP